MKLTARVRKLFAVGFMAGIGTVGVQDVDADGATDFTVRGRRRPLVERPVERDDSDGDAPSFCVLDIETTGFSPERDSIIEIAIIRTETEDGITRERVLNDLVRPSGNIPKRIRELTGITNEMVADAGAIETKCCHGSPCSSGMRRSSRTTPTSTVDSWSTTPV